MEKALPRDACFHTVLHVAGRTPAPARSQQPELSAGSRTDRAEARVIFRKGGHARLRDAHAWKIPFEGSLTVRGSSAAKPRPTDAFTEISRSVRIPVASMRVGERLRNRNAEIRPRAGSPAIGCKSQPPRNRATRMCQKRFGTRGLAERCRGRFAFDRAHPFGLWMP
jgi:hypothetical protein